MNLIIAVFYLCLSLSSGEKDLFKNSGTAGQACELEHGPPPNILEVTPCEVIQNPSKFGLWSPESTALESGVQLMASGIQNRILKSGILPLMESGIHGCGILNPRLTWVTLHGEIEVISELRGDTTSLGSYTKSSVILSWPKKF